MFKIFSRVSEALRAEADAAETPVWLRDPLAHPEIETMDSRALGDLPFGLFRTPALRAESGRRPL
ncbi:MULTISPECIES: hypothetical protein [unclassified Shinella]|uniref:hypothetical protein n=1 Tax=Shinella TaxID=323620 RepID=UPI00225D1BCD|nr:MULTISPECIES: hypothetical protein [unclassified Shinella]MCO5136307.1 hypothetical protein [Shinella sp.]MDC7254019.1 hypothetical protein [Shinella sp. YE25]CAI0336682.1 conserved hypothetical protein [Rhizobiaceae bacterium]CAK7255214.1 conserved protein of unknown function [Shinella sp. WSC3-e]